MSSQGDQTNPGDSSGIGSLARGTVLSFGCEIGRIVINYGYGIVIARTLGAEIYGIFFLGFAAFNLLALFSYCAVEDALMRFLGRYSLSSEQRNVRGVIHFGLVLSVALGALFGILCFVFADALAARVFHKPDLAVVLRYLSPGIPLFSLMTVAVTGLRGFRIIRPYVVVRKVLLPVLSVVLAGAVLAGGGSLKGLSISYLMAISVSAVVGFGILSSFLTRFEKHGFSRNESRRFTSFIGVAFVVNLLLFLFSVMDLGVVGMLRPSAELGVYFAAKRTAQMLTFLLMSLNAAFVPMVAYLHGGDHHDQLGVVFKTTARWMLSVGLPIFLCMVFFPGRILSLFGEEFVQGRIVLIILASGYLAHVVVGSTGYILMMTGHQKLMLVNALCIACGAALLTYGLTSRYGMFGAAVANAVVLGIANLVALLQISVLLRLSPWSGRYAAVLMAGTLMAAVLWFTRYIPGSGSWAGALVRALLGGVAYLLFVLRFGLAEKERQFLADLRGKLVQSGI